MRERIKSSRRARVCLDALSEAPPPPPPPQFMPRQLTVTGYNIGGQCDDCDEEGAYEYDYVFFKILSYKMRSFNQIDGIKLVNRLLLRDERFRCEECGTLLISYIDAIY
jgi:hypothetical protein